MVKYHFGYCFYASMLCVLSSLLPLRIMFVVTFWLLKTFTRIFESIYLFFFYNVFQGKLFLGGLGFLSPIIDITLYLTYKKLQYKGKSTCFFSYSLSLFSLSTGFSIILFVCFSIFSLSPSLSF